jgi:hypothetical protein
MMTKSEELYLLVAEKYEAEIAKPEGKDEQYITEVENILIGYIKGKEE